MDPLQNLLQYLNGARTSDSGLYDTISGDYAARTSNDTTQSSLQWQAHDTRVASRGSSVFEELDRSDDQYDAVTASEYPHSTPTNQRQVDQVGSIGSPSRLLMNSDIDLPTVPLSSPLPYSTGEPLQCATAQADTETRNSRASVSTELQRPPPAGPIIQGTELVQVASLPDSLRSVFPFTLFNLVQSRCFEVAYRSDDNLVISAPTSSGKTTIFELAICRIKLTYHTGSPKIVYISPTKALCSERRKDWESRFQHIGLRCAELTGDTSASDTSFAQSADVIVTTPEKWEATTRKWNDRSKLLRSIKLVLVDEVHMLKEERGATLEAVVSRMKSLPENIRFIALSATIPNAEDIATWLKRSGTSSAPAHCFIFGEDYRPVPIEKHVIGIDTAGGDYVMEHACDER